MWSMCSKLTKETPRRCHQANICLFKINNRNTRKRCVICSNLTIKIPEQHRWRRLSIFIVNFEHISHLFVLFLLLTLNKLVFWINIFKVDKGDTKTTSIKDLNVVFIPLTLNMHLHAGHNFPANACSKSTVFQLMGTWFHFGVFIINFEHSTLIYCFHL